MAIRSSRDDQPGPGGPGRAVRLLGRPGGRLPQGAGARLRRGRGLPARPGRGRSRPAAAPRSTTTAWRWRRSAPGRAGSGRGCTSDLPDARRRARAGEFIRAIIDFAGPFARAGDHRLDAGPERRRRRPRRRPSATWPRPSKTSASTPGQYGVPLIYEPLNRYETNLVNTVDGGRGAAPVALDAERRPAGRPVPHEHRGGGHRRGDPRRRRPASATSTSSTRTAARPGSGTSTIAPIAAALREIGYDGFASAEALPVPRPRRGRPADDRRVPPLLPSLLSGRALSLRIA